MQIGLVTVGGYAVGVITLMEGGPKTLAASAGTDSYVPSGRAAGRSPGDYGYNPQPYARHSPHPGHHATQEKPKPRFGGEGDTDPPVQRVAPPGKVYSSEGGGRGTRRASPEVDKAITDAAKAYNLDPNTMRAIASIESSNNPESNRERRTQYKGLYQIGSSEWDRFGEGGDIYNAHDNAMGAARMFAANRDAFRKNFGRDPTDTELYMMHQQGLGFYTRGAMTNIKGNPYPGMKGPQDHDMFEAGWGREIARRKDALSHGNEAPATATSPAAPNVPTTGGGRLTGSVDNRVDSRIPDILGAAATHLPPGYRVEMTSGYRGEGVPNHNGNAADFHIVDPQGNVLRNRGEDPGGMYQTLARHALGEQRARHPELNGRFAWGGAFGTQLGGGGERDLMHFDINGERGRYEQYQLRNMGPVPGTQYGKIETPTKTAGAPVDPETMAP